MRSLFLVVLLFFGTGLSQLYAAEQYECPENSKQVRDSGVRATFGIGNRHEDYLRGCFPCCFCCEGPGTCCNECKERNNTLVAPQAPNQN
jgi:hypothetical protein